MVFYAGIKDIINIKRQINYWFIVSGCLVGKRYIWMVVWGTAWAFFLVLSSFRHKNRQPTIFYFFFVPHFEAKVVKYLLIFFCVCFFSFAFAEKPILNIFAKHAWNFYHEPLLCGCAECNTNIFWWERKMREMWIYYRFLNKV